MSKERNREIQSNFRNRQREQAVWKYGGKCSCCGEAQVGFLQVIKKDDPARNKSMNFHYWLNRNGFPKGFIVRCYNCENVYKNYGICPHTADKKLSTDSRACKGIRKTIQ